MFLKVLLCFNTIGKAEGVYISFTLSTFSDFKTVKHDDTVYGVKIFNYIKDRTHINESTVSLFGYSF